MSTGHARGFKTASLPSMIVSTAVLSAAVNCGKQHCFDSVSVGCACTLEFSSSPYKMASIATACSSTAVVTNEKPVLESVCDGHVRVSGARCSQLLLDSTGTQVRITRRDVEKCSENANFSPLDNMLLGWGILRNHIRTKFVSARFVSRRFY